MTSKNLEQEQRVRERLFDVLAEFPVLYQARQGVGTKILNPFVPLENIVRGHINPLILYINDLVEEIKRGLPYLEAMDRVIRFALQYKHRDRIQEAVRQLSHIEKDRPYFLWGLAAFLGRPGSEQRAKRLQALHRRLHVMNREYSHRFGAGKGVDLIPWRVTFRNQIDGITEGTYEHPDRSQLEIFRQAIYVLGRIVTEHQLEKWANRPVSKRVRRDMEELARLLFDYGFSVEEICGRVREEGQYLGRFLNELLLSDMERTAGRRMGLMGVSRHMCLLSLLDYRLLIPFRTFYRRPSDAQSALAVAREIERREGVKVSAFRRLVQLGQQYVRIHRPLLAYYLDYQFSRAHGHYVPSRDESHFGIDLTKRLVLRYFDDREVQQKAGEAARKFYSSKATEEMIEVLRLLINALAAPEKIRGKRVHILGHIQSGAMGRVLIGVYQMNIVALKEPKPALPSDERIRSLDYEARIHAHVHMGRAQHENIVECFGMVEEGGRRFLAIGYHPAETLWMLIRRAGSQNREAAPAAQETVIVADFRVISLQLLRALMHLRDRRVVHRDLKPSNILYLVDEGGRVALIKVIDFGVALNLAASPSEDIHRERVVGTLGYMAPEMVFQEASYASDLYSIGVILYQLMAGRRPVEFPRSIPKNALRHALKRVLRERRLPLSEANPFWRRTKPLMPFGEMVDRMLSIDPGRRPAVDAVYDRWADAWERVPQSILEAPLAYPTPSLPARFR